MGHGVKVYGGQRLHRLVKPLYHQRLWKASAIEYRFPFSTLQLLSWSPTETKTGGAPRQSAYRGSLAYLSSSGGLRERDFLKLTKPVLRLASHPLIEFLGGRPLSLGHKNVHTVSFDGLGLHGLPKLGR